jgi:sec-independent protein translocase protein TatC
MARSRDLFDDTTMSFGEHLEVLRIHVFKAIVGLALAIALSLFFGDRIFTVLRHPVEDALKARGIAAIEIDAPKESFFSYLQRLWKGELVKQETPEEPKDDLRADQLRVSARVADVVQALQEVGVNVVPNPANPETPPNDPAPADGNATPDDGAEVAESAKEDAGPQMAAEPPKIEFVIQAMEFAQLRKVVDDKQKVTTLRIEEGFLSYMKVSFVAGFLLASPWVFYQIWQFVAAGLHFHERKYVYVYLPMSLGLFIAGAMAGYFYAFPLMLNFLISFNDWLNVDFTPRLSDYISMVLLMPLMFGISFQLPLVMLFLERLGIFTQQAYKSNWRIAVLVISVVSMILTPQDPGSMMLMMLPLVVLYWVGIWLCNFRINTKRSPIS